MTKQYTWGYNENVNRLSCSVCSETSECLGCRRIREYKETEVPSLLVREYRRGYCDGRIQGRREGKAKGKERKHKQIKKEEWILARAVQMKIANPEMDSKAILDSIIELNTMWHDEVVDDS